jgi:hypothetical protein
MMCSASQNLAMAEITPRLELGLYYNDNATLAESGDEQQAYITEIKPGILLVRDGRRFDGRLDYALQGLHFSGDIDETNTHHQLTADSTTMFVPQSLYLDAGATRSQQFITPDGTIDMDNLSDNENRSDVTTYSLSPYIRQRYGVIASAEYRLGYQRVEYEENVGIEEIDSSNSNASINIQSGPSFTELHWQFNYSYNEIDYDENDIDTLFKRSTLGLRSRMSPKFSVLANIGYEDNEYERVLDEEPPSGSIWSAGFAWTPTQRTSLEVTGGERFFGSTASVDFSHRTRRTRWNVTYSEDVTTASQIQAIDMDPDNELGVDIILRQTTSVILLERLSFVFSMETGRTTISSSLFKDRRTTEVDNEQEHSLGANFSVDWRFMPRTSVSVELTRYEIEPTASERTDTVTNTRIALQRRIRPSVTGSVGYGALRRESTDGSGEYDRNLISLTVLAEF